MYNLYSSFYSREKLPGPPQNVRIEPIDSHSVYIIWDPPIKNPHTVELYRVFWRPVDSSTKQLQKGDTAETQFEIANLKGKTIYRTSINFDERYTSESLIL